MVFAPSLAAEIAAANPAGPLPTTSTFVSAMTGIDLDGSWMNFITVTLAENLIYTRTLEILQILHLDNQVEIIEKTTWLYRQFGRDQIKVT
jgi:hypothetical protein